MIKILACAIAATVALTFYPTNTKADVLPITVVTNYSVINVALTVQTNVQTVNGPKVTTKIVSLKFTTKDLLNLLANADFANTTWPTGAQIVIGWDQPWESHVLVVDKSGTNVLYDVTANNQTNANFEINFFDKLGVINENFNGNQPGGETVTAYNNGLFDIDDHNAGIDIYGNGPSTHSLSISWDKNGAINKWSQSVTFKPQNGDQTINGYTGGTMFGTITLKGHGTSTPYDLYFLP
jgi:hypothetical protein